MISSPDAAASRSVFADWIELRALFYDRASHANITSALRLSSDDHREREREEGNGEIVEEEILEADTEAAINRTADEIAFRLEALGEAYPFDVQLRPLQLKLKSELGALSLPAQFYVFMLLMTAGKDKLCPVPDAKQRAGRTLFHICASYGVAGLLRGGATYWFGHPRPTQNGFLAALKDLSLSMGWSEAKPSVPPGLPDFPQDDGVDVVGWRSFGDRRVSTHVILCQAATGGDWQDKSIVTCLSSFLDWFERRPYNVVAATPSLAVPFPAHHEVSEPPAASFELAAYGALHRLQGKLGVVIDRLRIVECVRDVLKDAEANKQVGGADKIPDLQRWISDTVQAVAKAA